MADSPVRLQKFLAACSVASRRKCEELIAAGAVKVNGRVAMLGDKVSPSDKVTVHGRRVIPPKDRFVYVALHKPRGFITTMQDERGRKCVRELVEDVGERIFPVGRLDRESEGLLLMTNDGELANRITHPAHHVVKIYRVTVGPEVTEDQLDRMRTGVELDGRLTAPAQVSILLREPSRVVLQISIREGRNRQIRRMCEALGLTVKRLKRTAVGSVKLGMMHPGAWRYLTPEEVDKLKAAAGMERK